MNEASNAEQIELVAVLDETGTALVAELDQSQLVAVLGDLQ